MTPRRQFKLSQVDAEFLDSHYTFWETVVEDKSHWVLIDGFEVPAGYDHTVVSIALLIETAYPDVQIDMAYFLPALARTDGKNIGALSSTSIDQRTWQRWSRHRVGDDAWRPGIDNIETHLRYVTSFLETELKK
jgi:hypothetical protein